MAADIQTSLKNWSTNEASNAPSGTTAISSNLDDNIRMLQTVVRQDLAHKGQDIASASTMDIGAVAGSYHDVTGTTTVTGLGTVSAGIWKILQFDSTPQLTYNASSLPLPTAANITAEAGDHLFAVSLGSGNWAVPFYLRKSGEPLGPYKDSNPVVAGSSDATKKLRFEVDGIATATTIVVTVPTANGQMGYTSESDGSAQLPPMWIQGLTYSVASDAEHDTTIAAGSARDASDTANIVLASAITKQIDASWSVGTNQGGLDTGSVASNTWYAIWLIKRSDTGVVDALYSTSFSSPTMPSDYDKKRLIGAVKTDGSANILAYSVMETEGGGIESLWADPPLDVNEATPGTAANLRTLSVPTGIKVWAWVNAYFAVGSSTHGLYLSSPDVNDEAPSGSGNAPLASLGMGATSTSNPTHGPLRIRTNTSSQIRARQTVNSQQSIATLGWEWSRR